MSESLETFFGKVKLETYVKFPCASHSHPELLGTDTDSSPVSLPLLLSRLASVSV